VLHGRPIGEDTHVIIREYAPADRDACRELWRALTQRHRDIYGDPSIGGADPGLEFDRHLAHQRLAKVWVAAQDGELVGLCGLLVEHTEAELEPIVVHPARRRRGVGAALAQRAIAEARALGMTFINVRPVARNVEAIRFFRREGFRVLGRLELSLPLDAGAFDGGEHALDVHGVRFQY
jgi:N-acetylglutamate synthase-like GNAT family acetyltransferase